MAVTRAGPGGLRHGAHRPCPPVAPTCRAPVVRPAGPVGGKLVRPRLTVAAYLGLGGTDRAASHPCRRARGAAHRDARARRPARPRRAAPRAPERRGRHTRAPGDQRAGRPRGRRPGARRRAARGRRGARLGVLAGRERAGGPSACAGSSACWRRHRDHGRRGAARRAASLCSPRGRGRARRRAQDRRVLLPPAAGHRGRPRRRGRRAARAARPGRHGARHRVPGRGRRARGVRRPGGHRQVRGVGPARGPAHRAAAAGLRDDRRGRTGGARRARRPPRPRRGRGRGRPRRAVSIRRARTRAGADPAPGSPASAGVATLPAPLAEYLGGVVDDLAGRGR